MAVRPSEVERRPVARRSSPAAVDVAQLLVQWGVSANRISLTGMLAGVLAGVAFALTPWVAVPWVAWVLGALLVQARLVANLLDRMVALESGTASRVGELFNEVPDRVSDSAILIGLGHAVGGLPWLGDLAAVLALFVAYVRAVAKAAGAPQDYCGPMARPHRMAVVMLTALVCAVSPAGWPAMLFGRGGGWPVVALVLISAGSVVTAIRRLVRAGRFLESLREGMPVR